MLTARALETKRIFNALMEPDGIKIYRNVHMGIAIALENGLVVPVVRDANKNGSARSARRSRTWRRAHGKIA